MENIKNSYESLLNKEESIYTACYCEENVWKLIESIYAKHENINKCDLYAVFISNHSRMIPVFCQHVSPDPEKPVVWDYHVILVHKDSLLKQSYVYDFDSTLEFPVKFEDYMEKAIKSEKLFRSKFHRLFRVIDSEYFIENFSSDRSHMIKDKKTGEFLSEPPSYPCIKSKVSENNIQEFISMQTHHKHGKIMNHDEFNQYFTTY